MTPFYAVPTTIHHLPHLIDELNATFVMVMELSLKGLESCYNSIPNES